MTKEIDQSSNKAPKTAPERPKQSRIDDTDYHSLKEVPPESEWLQERKNRSPRTARAYEVDLNEFKAFMGIKKPEEYRQLSPKHISDWIAELLTLKLTNETICRKVSAVSSLFKYYCNRSALKDNPCKNITRPKVQSNIGKSDQISRIQARDLLVAPPSDSIAGLRDRAIIATFLFFALRRSEAAALKVNSIHQIQGVYHLRVFGKGSKIRNLVMHPVAIEAINTYLEKDKRLDFLESPLFCQIRKRQDKDGNIKFMSDDMIYRILKKYAGMVGIKMEAFHPHCLRSTWATTALENGADLAMVQEFLGHAHIQTTKIYDKRKMNISNSPAYKVSY